MFGLRRRPQTETAQGDVQLIAQADTAETRSFADPAGWLMELFGAAPAVSGISISAAVAMTCAPVRAAVEAISEALGCLPMHLYERGEGGARDRATDHPAYVLINSDANPWTSAGTLREQLTRDALLHGNGFAFINRDGTGIPRELNRLKPEAVTVEQDTTTGEPIYKFAANTGNGQRNLHRRDVLHIPAPSLDGLKGASPVQQCREAIGLALVMERHAARLFARGARPAGILKFPTKLGADSAKRIIAGWMAAHGGDKSGGVALLEEGADWQALTLNSVDSQFLEMRAFAVSEIARVFRVPPVLLMDYSRQTWANAETGGQQFLTYTLDRWLRVWADEVRLKLINPDDRATIYPEFLTDALLRSNFAERATAYGQYRSMGALTANEVRAGMNLPPLPGGDVLGNPYTTTTTAKPDAKPEDKTGGNTDE